MIKYLIAISLLLGCSGTDKENESQQSTPQVVNGMSTSEYNSIVQITMEYGSPYKQGYCTGTFIKGNLLLTASHCVDGASVVKLKSGVRSIGILKNPLYIEGARDWVSQDFALVKFPNGTSKYVMAIASTPLKNADSLLLVGYGINDYDRDGTASSNSVFGVKRRATNKYSLNSDLRDGIVSFTGRGTNVYGTSGSGTQGSLGQGDSGGPLILTGKGIIGIASAQALGNLDRVNFTNDSFYAYTISSQAAKFFTLARNRGFYDGSTITQPQPQTPDRPQPSGQFKVFGVGGEEDGIYSLVVEGIPRDATSVKFYWGYENIGAFHTEQANGRTSFETSYMWDFTKDKKVRIEVLSSNGSVIKEVKIILK